MTKFKLRGLKRKMMKFRGWVLHFSLIFFIRRGLYQYTFIFKEKSFLQTNSKKKNPSNFFYIILLCVNFENLTAELHAISYVLNMYVRFCLNWILFTIWLINLFWINSINILWDLD